MTLQPDVCYRPEEAAAILKLTPRKVRELFPWGQLSERIWRAMGADILAALHAPASVSPANECTAGLSPMTSDQSDPGSPFRTRPRRLADLQRSASTHAW